MQYFIYQDMILDTLVFVAARSFFDVEEVLDDYGYDTDRMWFLSDSDETEAKISGLFIMEQ